MSRFMLIWFVLVVVSVSWNYHVTADFAPIDEWLVRENITIPDDRLIAMYTKEDAPAGSEDSYIELDLTASTMNNITTSGKIQVTILQAINFDDLHYEDNQMWEYCCTQQLYEHGQNSKIEIPGCTNESQIGQLLIHDQNKHHQSQTIEFNDTAKTRQNNMRFYIKHTGEHILILSHCDENLAEPIHVEGMGEWRNPYGYLPGRLYGYLQFYGIMSLVYLGIGFIWFILNAYYWTEVMMVQNCITIVLAMCMAEMTTWYFDYQDFNHTGKRNITVVVIAIIITVSRQTLSRLLVLSVSLGWGVVRPTLGKNKFRLAALGFIYWLCETAFELVTRYSQTKGSQPDRIRTFLALPVAVLNAVFYWWIFIALYRITAQLEARRQESKLQLYRRFTHVLIFSLIITILFAGYQLYYMYTNSFLLHWSQLWLLDVGFSFIVYTVILLAIALLWRPSQNSRRYAYAEVARGTEDDGEFGDLELDEQPVKTEDPLGIGIDDESDDDVGPPAAGRFTVDDHDTLPQPDDPLDEMVGVGQPMSKLA